MRRGFDQAAFRAVPLVAILRGIDPAVGGDVLAALVAGGVTTIEFTFNDAEVAARQLRGAVAAWGGRLNLGAGTITDPARLRLALDAGATFIVTPCLTVAVVGECVARGVPVFPGVLSMGEIVAARDRGVRCVKLFPADRVGPAFVERAKQMLPELEIMPTGGVSLDSVTAWKRAGADALGVGAPLLDPTLIGAGDWDGLASRATAFVERWTAG